MWILTETNGETIALENSAVSKLLYSPKGDKTIAITKAGETITLCRGDKVKRIVKAAYMRFPAVDLSTDNDDVMF